MSAKFLLDHRPLAADARFRSLAAGLGRQTHIDSRASFNQYCRAAIDLWRAHFAAQPVGPPFADLLRQIEEGGPQVIRTGWGGVVITLHEHPRVEKYLVIRPGGFLALEKHEQKDEQLEVREGAGLLLWRREPGEPLAVQALEPGGQFHFIPGVEHCVIGTENLLIFERSCDPRGWTGTSSSSMNRMSPRPFSSPSYVC